ncbi:MAG: HDOD domain-containing protein [Nitrospinae bacterium]|nr:HDOD domain-containing protein [Nitrospinota bacterium]
MLKKIPRLPPYASSLAAKLMDPNVNVGDISQMIKSDPSLTALTLKVANSGYYSFPMKITNINQAVMLLGVKQIYRMVMDQSLKNFFPPAFPEFEQLQKHSYLVSIITEEIADATGRLHLAGLVNTLGLLHDIGRSVIMLLKRKNPQFNEKLDMVDHVRLGGQLLAQWGLPEPIYSAIRDYAELKSLPPDDVPHIIRDDVAILHVAHVCAALVLDDGEALADNVLYGRCMTWLGAEGVAADRFWKEKLSKRLASRLRNFPENIQAVLKKHLSLAW